MIRCVLLFIRCIHRYSLTPLLTQAHKVESRKYIKSQGNFLMSNIPRPFEDASIRIKDACAETKDACAGNACIDACARRDTCTTYTYIPVSGHASRSFSYSSLSVCHHVIVMQYAASFIHHAVIVKSYSQSLILCRGNNLRE
jgi:hypothetical protein